jgi:uncharacterized protein with von Willebrand factor type A (vWA) domain
MAPWQGTSVRLPTGWLGRWAELIGRFRQMATAERARKTEHAVGGLVGSTLDDDLGALIPSELASLGVPAQRGVFAARHAEQRLYAPPRVRWRLLLAQAS